MVNRNPYVPPEREAEYRQSSVVNEATKPAQPATRKPAATPVRKAPAKRRK